MKRINNKGFTLIELLAVVVILLAVSVVAVSSISAAIERNKAKQNATKKEVIVSYAKIYYDERKNKLNPSGCILVADLPLSESEMTDADGEVFTGGVSYQYGNNFQYVETCP